MLVWLLADSFHREQATEQQTGGGDTQINMNPPQEIGLPVSCLALEFSSFM